MTLLDTPTIANTLGAANRFPDSCSANPPAAKALNVSASRNLAEATISRSIFLIYISTDYVFSGKPGEAPYLTTSPTNPPNTYGQTKLDGENAVLEVAREAGVKNKVVILRVPLLYGKCDEPHQSAVNVLMSLLWTSQSISPNDTRLKIDNYALRFPTNTSDVARVCRDLSKFYLNPPNSTRDLPTTLHFSSEDRMTKWQICQTFAEIMGLPLDGMEAFQPDDDPKDGVQRPYDCHLDISALRHLGIDTSTVNFTVWWYGGKHPT
jgi:S-adenosylmethionine synthetase